MTVKREFELSEEDAEFIDDRVRAGGKPDEVLGEAIELLRGKEEMIERWMREKVIPSYDQWVADGKPVFTEEEAEAAVEAVIAQAEQRKVS